jgi:F0F1-type ATP synthase membrane subunit c/vacuolar-type H+-ATPase subunit K
MSIGAGVRSGVGMLAALLVGLCVGRLVTSIKRSSSFRNNLPVVDCSELEDLMARAIDSQ